jgi:hypothetical protein
VALVYLKSLIGGYFFDVIFSEDYVFETVVTQHPVQSGANVNDHVYQQPATITFDVGVSNCLGSIVKGQFDGLKVRTASAFAIFQMLQKTAPQIEVDAVINGVIFPFFPMVIKSLKIRRDKSTQNALRMTVVMQQIILTDAVSQEITFSRSYVWDPLSDDPQTTDQTNTGTQTPSTSDAERIKMILSMNE